MTPVLHMLCTLSCLPSLEIGKKICGSCVRHPAYTHSILFIQLDYSQQVGLCARVCLHMHVSGFFSSIVFTMERPVHLKISISVNLQQPFVCVFTVDMLCQQFDKLTLLMLLAYAVPQNMHLRSYGSCLPMLMRFMRLYRVLLLIATALWTSWSWANKNLQFFFLRLSASTNHIGCVNGREKQCVREKQQCLLLLIEHEIEQHQGYNFC